MTVNVLSMQERVRVVSALVEGTSLRATERLTGVFRQAITGLLLCVGEGCRWLLDATMRDLHCDVLELDEVWCFVAKKEARVTPDDPPEYGDTYTWVALDARTSQVLAMQSTLSPTLLANLARFPGARISVQTFENGPPIDAPVAVRLTGRDLGVLKALAARTEAILKATPGTRDVANPVRLDRTDLDLGVDEGKAAALGVPAGAPRRVVRLALSGEETGRFRDPDGDDYAVKVRLPMTSGDGALAAGDHNALADLAKVYVPTAEGEAAPLGAIDIGKLMRLSLSGGHIRNLALNAAFLAADEDSVITMRHLRDAAAAEFAKLERPLPAADVGDWL